MPAATKDRGSAGRRPDRSRPLVNVLVDRFDAERAARLLHQIALDERVDVTVEHAIDVADLLLRAVILDEPIRMQHVAANLVAERDVFLDAADLLEPGLILPSSSGRKAVP